MEVHGQFDQDAFPYVNIQVMNKQKERSATVKAIIDTGAAHCMIREDLAKQLALEILRTADYLHPVFGKMPLVEYLMDLQFNTEGREVVSFEGVRAGTLVDTQYPASMIVGVELLKHCTFTYDGLQQRFTLSFPAK